MIKLRTVKENEKDLAMQIINMAKAHLKNQGIDQWQDGYPDIRSIEADISSERGYFLTDGDCIAGYLCLDFEGEEVYRQLDGKWHYDGKYAALHRLAVSDEYRGRGYGIKAFAAAEEYCRSRGVSSIRVDTKHTNPKMRHVITKSGFEYRGDVYYEVSGERMAFEKVF